MSRQARYHIIPRFLLNGFTSSGASKGILYEFDIEQGACRRTKPANTAYRRDYYRIDIAGLDPDTIEKLIELVESSAADALRVLSEEPLLIEDEDILLSLMYLVSLMLLRTPTYRGWLEDYFIKDNKRYLRKIVSSRETFESTMAKMGKDGFSNRHDIGYEGMKDFVDKDKYTIRVPKERLIHNMLEFLHPIARVLRTRKWTVVFVQEGCGDLICSDHPVALLWDLPNPPAGSPGLMLQDTQITMPLSRKMFVHGAFHEAPSVHYADKQGVAIINSHTVAWSKRFIYGPDDHFIWTRPDAVIGDWPDYLRFVRDRSSFSA